MPNLPIDPQEQYMRLLAKHEPSVRAYVRASLPSSHDVAEVMQEVSVIAWRKFGDLDDAETGFGKWMCVIARYEMMKYRRGKARDRLILDSDIVERLADEGVEEASIRQGWIDALEACLGKLPQRQHELLLKAYRPEISIKELATELGKKPDALYQILRRLRLVLAECVERTRAQEI